VRNTLLRVPQVTSELVRAVEMIPDAAGFFWNPLMRRLL